MEELFVREVFYYKNYYLKFFSTLAPDVQRKFNWTLKLVATVDRIPQKFFKHLDGTTGIYEIRVEVGNEIFRVFCFFDNGRLIILINGFKKKTRKTPKSEIKQAEKLKKQYFDEKSAE